MSRRDEIEANLRVVRSRIAGAADASGRDPDDVALVVVTKNFSASDIRILAELGITDIAENRHQEAVAKAEECADLGLTWHFVGGLQSNKAAAVTSYAQVVQSVDRRKLLKPLARGAHEHDRQVDVLIQVSLDDPGAEHRSGVDPDLIDELAAGVVESEGLRLRGVMAVAPLDAEPAPAFARLARIHESLLQSHPAATWRSAGMSGDLEHAVEHGATHVRIGSAVLGSRPSFQ